MITEKKVLKAVGEYRMINLVAARNQRKEQYQLLINKHGLHMVAIASGLNKTTLRQYLCATNPSIGYEPLAQAIAVFNKLG